MGSVPGALSPWKQGLATPGRDELNQLAIGLINAELDRTVDERLPDRPRLRSSPLPLRAPELLLFVRWAGR